jgi:hypothetical protein
MLYNLRKLLSNEEQVADTTAQLHNPYADINDNFAALTEYFKAKLGITANLGVSFGYL